MGTNTTIFKVLQPPVIENTKTEEKNHYNDLLQLGLTAYISTCQKFILEEEVSEKLKAGENFGNINTSASWNSSDFSLLFSNPSLIQDYELFMKRFFNGEIDVCTRMLNLRENLRDSMEKHINGMSSKDFYKEELESDVKNINLVLKQCGARCFINGENRFTSKYLTSLLNAAQSKIETQWADYEKFGESTKIGSKNLINALEICIPSFEDATFCNAGINNEILGIEKNNETTK